jgi:hypothetical protein
MWILRVGLVEKVCQRLMKVVKTLLLTMGAIKRKIHYSLSSTLELEHTGIQSQSQKQTHLLCDNQDEHFSQIC